MLNIDLFAPKPITVDSSSHFDVDLVPTWRGIDILGPGATPPSTLTVIGINDQEVTYTFGADEATPSGIANSRYPYRLNLQIRRIVGTGTTLADTDLVGLI